MPQVLFIMIGVVALVIDVLFQCRKRKNPKPVGHLSIYGKDEPPFTEM